MVRTPQETFAELTDRVGKLVAGDHGQVEGLAALYGEITNVSFPLAPIAPLRSSAAVQAHFAKVAAGLGSGVTMRAEDVQIHETADPEVVVAEFRYVGEGPDGGFTMPNVIVMRVRDGQIIESRAYTARLSSEEMT